MNQRNPLVHSGQDELREKIAALWNKTKKYFLGMWSWFPRPLASPTEKNEFHAPSLFHKLSEEKAREQECTDRFIKVKAKHITDGQVSRSLAQGKL